MALGIDVNKLHSMGLRIFTTTLSDKKLVQLDSVKTAVNANIDRVEGNYNLTLGGTVIVANDMVDDFYIMPWDSEGIAKCLDSEPYTIDDFKINFKQGKLNPFFIFVETFTGKSRKGLNAFANERLIEIMELEALLTNVVAEFLVDFDNEFFSGCN